MSATMKSQYAPRTLEQKLAYFVEECGEVLAAVGKTQRWGPVGVNPELPDEKRETNAAWILRELPDLERAIHIVRDGLNEAMGSDVTPGETKAPPWPPRKGDVWRHVANGKEYTFTGATFADLGTGAERGALWNVVGGGSFSQLEVEEGKLRFVRGSPGAAGVREPVPCATCGGARDTIGRRVDCTDCKGTGVRSSTPAEGTK
jgi:hypothetical protein